MRTGWPSSSCAGGGCRSRCVGAGLLVQAEYLGGQLVLAHHPTGAAISAQHALLARGQRHWLVGQAEAPRIQVVDQRAATLLAFAAADAAAQQCLDPRFQLGQFERLGQVIVGTEVEPVHAVADLAARGEHQYRQRLATLAQARQHLKAVEPWQADIENRQRIVLAGQRQVGGNAVVEQVHGPAGGAQGPGPRFRPAGDGPRPEEFALPVLCDGDGAPV